MLGKRFVTCVLCMLVIASTLFVFSTMKNKDITASGDSEPGGNTGMGLNYTYMWKVTTALADIAHRYEPGEIPKGRAFGSKGCELLARDIIYKEMIQNLTPTLTNIKKDKLGPLENFPNHNYTSTVDVVDYQLTIEHPDYVENTNLPRDVPWTECFPIASGVPDIFTGELTHNYEMKESEDVHVIKPLIDYMPVGCPVTNEYKNVISSPMHDVDLIFGNVSLIDNSNELPDDQFGRVFLINNTISNLNILDNITADAAVVLIPPEEKETGITNVTKYTYPIQKINSTDENLTNITERLRNGEDIYAQTIFNSNTITFCYNLSGIVWPDHNFIFIVKLNTTTESIFGKPLDTDLQRQSWGIGGYLWLATGFYRWQNKLHPNYHCKGFIIYSEKEDGTHYQMMINVKAWYRISISFPCLPVYSVNRSIGEFLDEYTGCCCNTVTGFINQMYYKENHGENPNVGIEAYDIAGNITIPKSPDNKIVVISNRHDSFWGECSLDSGAGAGIVLGIAKYFKEHQITPKYNLTFLQTTGEEYGFRGAQFYSDNHSASNIFLFLGVDQLGMEQEGTYLNFNYKYPSTRSIVMAIVNDSHYDQRTKYGVVHNTEYNPSGDYGDGTEDLVWRQRNFPPNYYDCDTIMINKEGWNSHHQTGMNFAEGDSLKNTNRSDLNVTFELFWNITKYFCVNPDCWFSNVSFKAVDSPNDGDTLNDSIQANFTVYTILPTDKVRVKLFYNVNGNPESANNYYSGTDYVLTSDGIQRTLSFSIPDTVSQGNFSVFLRLYNSTGRINDIIGMSGTNYNATSNTSNTTHLYHPLGYTKIGNSYKCVDDNISGSVFTANENGRAENITAFINQAYMSPGPYKCMLYRASDGALIGNTTSDWVSLPQGDPESSSWWAVFNFTGDKPYLVKGTQYVITCWGDSPYSRVYYDGSGSSETGRYYYQPYGDPPSQLNFSDEPRYYSLYCSYTPDIPRITDVVANPYTVGFGYNITISANVTAQNGVNLVKVQINTPEGGLGVNNYTMSHTSGDTYQYVVSNTWSLGQYNYTIWAIDNMSNVNSSTGHHFHVSAEAQISIATLKESYTNDEFINLTDPPDPPENLTVIGRGLTWDKYYNATSGCNVLEVSTGPINYLNDNDTWMPINSSFYQLTTNHPAYTYGYRIGNDRGLFGVFFKTNAQNSWPVAFAYNRSDDPATHVIRSKLVGVGYLDPQSNWSYQYLQNVQSSQGQFTGNTAMYADVFTGTNVTWSYGNTRLKEEIMLSNTTKTMLQNHPPSSYGLHDTSSYLVFITKLDHQNLNLYNASGMLSGNVTISDAGVEFKDALGQFKCTLPLGEAYESNNESVREKLTYRIIHLNGNTYLLSGLKLSDLNTMTFPVVIDPTITVNASTSDGYLYHFSTNYLNSWNASTSNGFTDATHITIGQKKQSSTYYIDRGFVFFNTSTLPTNAYIDNASLSLYKSSDSSTTDFLITIQNGQPTYPHDPLQSSDYNKAHYSGNGGALNTSGLGNGYNNISLNNNGISWINRTGWTKLCLRSSRDINGNTPTGDEYVTVYASEQGSGYQPKLIITYRNQSKIKNTGSTSFKGYLLVQVQFYDSKQGLWVSDITPVNETFPRTINISGQLALDQIFNGGVKASDLLHGAGTYRVYTAFRDPTGAILKTGTESGGGVGGVC
jgi:hypothetical protein